MSCEQLVNITGIMEATDGTTRVQSYMYVKDNILVI